MKRINSNVSRAALIGVPLPERTESYTPIPNKDIIDCVYDNMRSHNFNIVKERYMATNTMGQFIGHYTVDMGDSGIFGEIAVRNSYDKSRSFLTLSGSTIWACLNGMFSADNKYIHKHTGTVDTYFDEEIKFVFDKLEEQHRLHLEAARELKQVRTNKEFVKEVIGKVFADDMYDGVDIFNSYEFNLFLKQCKISTTFKHIDDNECSAWDIYNHGTYALKEAHPNDHLEKHIRWHELMMEMV